MKPLAAAALLVFFWSSAVAADLPDLTKTPGTVRPRLTKAKICTIKWGADARHVTAAMKAHVFAAYGFTGNSDPKCIPASATRRCEIDHLISRELGGADVEENLWPEPFGTQPWNAARKDRLENRLHKEVCAGHLSLKHARTMIVQDWRTAYVHYFGEPPGP